MGVRIFKLVGLFLTAVLLTRSASALQTVDTQQTETVRVLTIQGKVEASTNGVVWRPLTDHEDWVALEEGQIVVLAVGREVVLDHR